MPGYRYAEFDTCPDPSTGLFIHDQYPPPADQAYIKTVAVDSWTGLLASEFCKGHIIDKTFVAVDDPAAVDWLNNTPEGQDFANKTGFVIPVQAPPQAGCVQGQSLPLVNISAPNDGAVIRGPVEIRGQAQAPDFDRFELQYAPQDDRENFLPISASLVEMPNYGTVLGVWDTAALQVPDGAYILRLIARSTNGGSIVFEINLTVNNPEPTSVPAPTGTPERAVFQPTIVSILLPTPTP